METIKIQYVKKNHKVKLTTFLLFKGKNNLPNSSEILGFFFSLFIHKPDSESVCYLPKEESKKTSASAETLLTVLYCWDADTLQMSQHFWVSQHWINT